VKPVCLAKIKLQIVGWQQASFMLPDRTLFHAGAYTASNNALCGNKTRLLISHAPSTIYDDTQSDATTLNTTINYFKLRDFVGINSFMMALTATVIWCQ